MESSNSLVHLVAKLETLVSRFENALGGPAVPLGTGQVNSSEKVAAPAKKQEAASAPV